MSTPSEKPIITSVSGKINCQYCAKECKNQVGLKTHHRTCPKMPGRVTISAEGKAVTVPPTHIILNEISDGDKPAPQIMSAEKVQPIGDKLKDIKVKAVKEVGKFVCECGKAVGSKGALTTHKKTKCPLGASVVTEKDSIAEAIEKDIKSASGEKAALLTAVKSVHDLFKNNGSIMGEAAMKDIFRLLYLKLNREYLVKLSTQYEKFEVVYMKYDSAEIKRDYLPLLDWENFYKETTFQLVSPDDGAITIIKIIGELLLCDDQTKIFFHSDNWLNIRNADALKSIINIIHNIKFDTTNKDFDPYGFIYEYMMNDYAAKKGKEYGQFFTPRPIVHYAIETATKLFKEIPENREKTSLRVYDPCMGTGGFLSEAVKLLGYDYKLDIVGRDVQKDTLMYGSMNLLIHSRENMKSINYDLKCCDSLRVIPSGKFDFILTNPPFGGSGFMCTDLPGIAPHIYNKDMLSLRPEAVFSYMTTKLLADNGIIAIVLPNGGLFESKNFLKWRKNLITNFNILQMTVMPSKEFNKADVITNLLFITTGKTTNIKVFDLVKGVETFIVDMKIDEIIKNDYSLRKNRYLDINLGRNLNIDHSIQIVEFGEIAELQIGKYAASHFESNINDVGKLITTGNPNVWRNVPKEMCDLNGKNIFISQLFGGTEAKVNIRYYSGLCCHSDCIYHIKLSNAAKKIVYLEYLYSYLFNRKNYINEDFKKGSCQKRLDVGAFNKFKIELPSFAKQKIIGDLFVGNEKIKRDSENLIADFEQMIFNAIELVCMNKDTEKVEFGKIGTITKGVKGSQETPEDKNGNGLLIGSSKLGKYKKITSEAKPKERTYISTFLPKGGESDNVYSVFGYYNGISEASTLMGEILLNDVGEKLVSYRYLYYYLLMHSKFISDSYQKGSCQKSLDIDGFNKFLISIPPIDTQQKITNLMVELDALRKNMDDKLSIFNELIQKFN